MYKHKFHHCAYALQDVLFPIKSVRLAGGYVVHQVTAAETLRTGDQVQLHLDEVGVVGVKVTTPW